jgi:hypothetical protein
MGNAKKLWVGFCLSGLMAALALGSPARQATGPIGYWRLDDTASPAEDAIGTADGVWNGAVTAVSDIPGPITTAHAVTDCGSLKLRTAAVAGAPNYVSLGRSAALDNIQNGSFTLSAWFKPNSIPAGTGDDTQYGIVLKTGLHEGLSLAGNGFVMGHWMGTNPDYYSAGYGTTTATVGAWHHLAGVVDMATHEVRLYVNGSPPPFNQAMTFPAGVSAWAGYLNEPWLIGINNPAGGSARYQADGTVDDVRIYDRALSTTEIQTLANGGIVGDPPSPPPAIPTGLTATGSSNQISLSWNPVSGATGYNVKRSTGAGLETQLAVAPTNSYVDTPLSGGPYFYVVSALVGCSESSNSVEVSASPVAPLPPPPRTAKVGKEHDPCGCGSAVPSRLGLLLSAGLALLALGYERLRRSQSRT